MQMTNEAREWLDATVKRIMARHHLAEPERAGVHYELMSHLHGAAERKASDAGRSEVTKADIETALLDMGGEEALARAFVAPLATQPHRAGFLRRSAAFVIDAILLAVGGMILLMLLMVLLAPLGILLRWPFGPWDMAGHGSGMRMFWMMPFFWFGLFGLGALLDLAYFTFLEGATGTTLGKRVLDLRVARSDGRSIGYREAFVRSLSKAFLPLLLLDALFMVLVDPDRRQRASDRLADTIVVEG